MSEPSRAAPSAIGVTKMNCWLAALSGLAIAGIASASRADQAGAPQSMPADAPSPICTDRPTKSTGTCTVNPGHFQYEADIVNGSTDRLDGATTNTYLVLSPTLKYGLTDHVDLEVSLAPIVQVRTRGDGRDSKLTGMGDVSLKAKGRIYSRGTVEIAVVPYVKAPTARRGLGNGAWEGGLLAPVAFQISPRCVLNVGLEADLLEDASGRGRHLNTSEFVNLGCSLPGDVTLFAEFWADRNPDLAATAWQTSADSGIAWLLSRNLQLDGGVNIGLNRQTPDAQVYIGLSQRF